MVSKKTNSFIEFKEIDDIDGGKTVTRKFSDFKSPAKTKAKIALNEDKTRSIITYILLTVLVASFILPKWVAVPQWMQGIFVMIVGYYFVRNK